MTRNEQGLQGGPPRQKLKRRASSRSRRRLAKYFRLLILMFSLFLCTFIVSSLLSGNAHRLGQAFRNIATPGLPKLIIQDAQYQHKVSALSRKNAQALCDHLNTNCQENQGIVALNAGSSVTELQNQSSFQKLLTKINYNPETLQIKQGLSQKVEFASAPSTMNVLMFFNDQTITAQSLESINSFLPESDGTCYVVVEALWKAAKSWQQDRSGVYCFAIKFDRPAVFSLNTESIDPGELLVFYAEYLSPGEAVSVQSNLPLNLQFAPYGQKQMIALAPISYDIRPGVYSTTLTAGETSQTFDITVKDKEFAVQYVTMDPQILSETRTEETNKEFQEKITPILSEQLPQLLWQGKASLPVPEDKVLTLFGSRRYVNDDANSYRHSGLDLAAPIGTEVRAVNDGKVLFAEFLAYTGNTIIIEHGLGLKSWYYHMDELRVNVGDSVKKDDVIGLSGQTGFAAEPHLHLNLSIGDTYINPVTAFNAPLFTDPLP
ncbi:MAG: M23 family metallopeptidase [Clostridiales bacterium]